MPQDTWYIVDVRTFTCQVKNIIFAWEKLLFQLSNGDFFRSMPAVAKTLLSAKLYNPELWACPPYKILYIF